MKSKNVMGFVMGVVIVAVLAFSAGAFVGDKNQKSDILGVREGKLFFERVSGVQSDFYDKIIYRLESTNKLEGPGGSPNPAQAVVNCALIAPANPCTPGQWSCQQGGSGSMGACRFGCVGVDGGAGTWGAGSHCVSGQCSSDNKKPGQCKNAAEQ